MANPLARGSMTASIISSMSITDGGNMDLAFVEPVCILTRSEQSTHSYSPKTFKPICYLILWGRPLAMILSGHAEDGPKDWSHCRRDFETRGSTLSHGHHEHHEHHGNPWQPMATYGMPLLVSVYTLSHLEASSPPAGQPDQKQARSRSDSLERRSCLDVDIC